MMRPWEKDEGALPRRLAGVEKGWYTITFSEAKRLRGAGWPDAALAEVVIARGQGRRYYVGSPWPELTTAQMVFLAERLGPSWGCYPGSPDWLLPVFLRMLQIPAAELAARYVMEALSREERG